MALIQEGIENLISYIRIERNMQDLKSPENIALRKTQKYLELANKIIKDYNTKLQKEIKNALRNARRQKTKEERGINVRISSNFWYQVAREYEKQLK